MLNGKYGRVQSKLLRQTGAGTGGGKFHIECTCSVVNFITVTLLKRMVIFTYLILYFSYTRPRPECCAKGLSTEDIC